MVAKVKIGELRGNLAEVLEFVKTKQQPVSIMRHGKVCWRIIPEPKQQSEKFVQVSQSP